MPGRKFSQKRRINKSKSRVSKRSKSRVNKRKTKSRVNKKRINRSRKIMRGGGCSACEGAIIRCQKQLKWHKLNQDKKDRIYDWLLKSPNLPTIIPSAEEAEKIRRDGERQPIYDVNCKSLKRIGDGKVL